MRAEGSGADDVGDAQAIDGALGKTVDVDELLRAVDGDTANGDVFKGWR